MVNTLDNGEFLSVVSETLESIIRYIICAKGLHMAYTINRQPFVKVTNQWQDVVHDIMTNYVTSIVVFSPSEEHGGKLNMAYDLVQCNGTASIEYTTFTPPVILNVLSHAMVVFNSCVKDYHHYITMRGTM